MWFVGLVVGLVIGGVLGEAPGAIAGAFLGWLVGFVIASQRRAAPAQGASPAAGAERIARLEKRLEQVERRLAKLDPHDGQAATAEDAVAKPFATSRPAGADAGAEVLAPIDPVVQATDTSAPPTAEVKSAVGSATAGEAPPPATKAPTTPNPIIA